MTKGTHHLVSADALGITEEQRKNACKLLLYLRDNETQLEADDTFDMSAFVRLDADALEAVEYSNLKGAVKLTAKDHKYPCGSSACLLGHAIIPVPPSAEFMSWYDASFIDDINAFADCTEDWTGYARVAFGVDNAKSEVYAGADGRPISATGWVFLWLFGGAHNSSLADAIQRLGWWLCGRLPSAEACGCNHFNRDIARGFAIPWREVEAVVV
jgi:hypothetical protein